MSHGKNISVHYGERTRRVEDEMIGRIDRERKTGKKPETLLHSHRGTITDLLHGQNIEDDYLKLHPHMADPGLYDPKFNEPDSDESLNGVQKYKHGGAEKRRTPRDRSLRAKQRSLERGKRSSGRQWKEAA